MELVFTSYCRARLFRKIEKLVEKAPVIQGWQFFAMQPQRPLDFFIEEDFPDVEIDPYEIVFRPPAGKGYANKEWLKVYARIGEGEEGRRIQAVKAVMLNVLGEKAYTIGLRDIGLEDISQLTEQQLTRMVNITELPAHMRIQELSGMAISYTGKLAKAK